jgi:AraC-like DNA-binding protein
MNAKEQFDKIIETIEILSNDLDGIKARDIAEHVSSMLGLGCRDVGAIFAFLTGYSLLDYIKERKLMAAYKMLISIPLLDIEGAITVSGYDNQSSFGKKFKEYFDMTPTEAFEKKDQTRYTSAFSWSSIVSNNVKSADNLFPQESSEKTKFGITQTQYAKIMEAADYQALYGFNDIQSDAAFQVAEEMQVPLKDAFEFIDDFSNNYCLNDNGEFNVSAEELYLLINAAPELKYVYFKITNSVYEALNLIGEAKTFGYNLMEIDPEYISSYLNDSWRFDEFMFLVEKFEELGGADFDDFIFKVGLGFPIEEAVKDDLDDDDGLDCISDTDEIEEMIAFEKWANELTDYTNQDQIDIDYDEDNPYYSNEEDNDIIDTMEDWE